MENFGKAPVDAATYGQFYAGDSYVMVRPGAVSNGVPWCIVVSYLWMR